MRGNGAFMPQPQRYHCDVYAGLQQVHCDGVAKDMRRDTLPPQLRMLLRCSLDRQRQTLSHRRARQRATRSAREKYCVRI